MFVVMYKALNRLNCEQQVFGPFNTYEEAEDALSALPVAKYCEWKFIQELQGISAALGVYAEV